LPLVLRWGL